MGQLYFDILPMGGGRGRRAKYGWLTRLEMETENEATYSDVPCVKLNDNHRLIVSSHPMFELRSLAGHPSYQPS